jgi:hypothetical protein
MNPQVQTTIPGKFKLIPGNHIIGAISDIDARERITALILTAMTASRCGIPFHVACTSPVSYKLFRRALGDDLVTKVNTESPAVAHKEITDLFSPIKGENTLLLFDAEISTYEMILKTSGMFACGSLSAIVPILPNKCSKQAAADIQKTLPYIKTVFLTLGSQKEEEKYCFAIWEWPERSDYNSIWDYKRIPDHVAPFVIRSDEFADLPPLTEFRSYLSQMGNGDPIERAKIAQVLAYLEAGCSPISQHLLDGIIMPSDWSFY